MPHPHPGPAGRIVSKNINGGISKGNAAYHLMKKIETAHNVRVLRLVYSVEHVTKFQHGTLVGRQDARTLLYNINEQHPSSVFFRADAKDRT